jgi:hypothetical protein
MTKFTPVGAAQNRWFTMQDVGQYALPLLQLSDTNFLSLLELIGQGGLVAKGFMQYAHTHIPLPATAESDPRLSFQIFPSCSRLSWYSA